MSNSYLSTLICRQAKKYGDRIALKYRDYETEAGYLFHGISLLKR